MNHTPGPWSAFISCDTIAVDIGAMPSGKRPCIVNWTGFESCDLPLAEQEANARLIAAAPDLLAALKLALHVRGTSEDTPEVAAAMESAIAKAEGRDA